METSDTTTPVELQGTPHLHSVPGPQALSTTYVLDAENSAERAQLFNQDGMLTEAMGGTLPELTEKQQDDIYDVLDLGCGPGGWALRLAREDDNVTVRGIDSSASMISYAQTAAASVENALFVRGDVTKPLPFADASFDLVNARLISGFLLPQQWSSLLAECRRVLKPGGFIRLTEGEWGFVTASSPAVARLFGLGIDAMHRAGRSFSPDGRYHAITPMLLQFVRDAGFADVKCKAHAIDHSYGTRAYAGFVADYTLLFRLGQPFILQQQLATQSELDELYIQALTEMQAERFGALLYLLTVWGIWKGAR